ncbi:flagellar biosynthetic protein FliR [Rheinheimera sp. MMS21-TC3]|uniref:flagellar biosynthetic protein FliR n=1 Tax=Rheinheimera sp. MMS21-TC3 TaxID=3072790 RepID=UPI0028C3EB66|nr:flagellar biosynthetic protein FliR [Rheinheimera sp. MMS21-TC3]WNO61785.1 flagellar biosynthetic protein FliR [Rheinheimera sp. MMS21-TC3]
MEFPLSILMQTIADYLLPLCRVTGMFLIMAGIGVRNVPMRIKTGLVVMITLIIMPTLPPVVNADLMSGQMIIEVLLQLMIGFALGFISLLFITTFVVAGQLLATQTGLGFASMVDPASGVSVPAIGQFYLVLATLLFWLFDGHLIMIQMLVFSFETLPINGQWWDVSSYWVVLEFAGWMFATALAIALAPIISMLTVNLSFGIMTRAAPQLNVFSIGFPITMLSGLVILWLTLDTFLFHFEKQWQHSIEYSCRLIGC